MKELDFKRIGERIRARRQSMGITQEQVANLLDVNPSHVSNIECGRSNPSLTALVNIANILDCGADLFLADEYTSPGTALAPDVNERIMTALSLYGDEKKEKLLEILKLL